VRKCTRNIIIKQDYFSTKEKDFFSISYLASKVRLLPREYDKRKMQKKTL